MCIRDSGKFSERRLQAVDVDAVAGKQLGDRHWDDAQVGAALDEDEAGQQLEGERRRDGAVPWTSKGSPGVQVDVVGESVGHPELLQTLLHQTVRSTLTAQDQGFGAQQ